MNSANQSLEGRVALVTGGSRGIGQAIAIALSNEGATIIIVFKERKEAAEQTLRQLAGDGHISLQCDITKPDNITRLFEQVQQEFDHLDIVVNNAGIGYHHPVDTTSFDDWQTGWRHILSANLIAPSNIAWHASQIMIEQGHGRIINVTSRGAFRGEPDQPAYGASKAGLNSLTQSLAHKLSAYGIFVGAVAPGFVETDMAYDRLQGDSGRKIREQSPMNRVAKPEEVAQAVLLMSYANIWMTGSIFDVNGASYFRT